MAIVGNLKIGMDLGGRLVLPTRWIDLIDGGSGFRLPDEVGISVSVAKLFSE